MRTSFVLVKVVCSRSWVDYNDHDNTWKASSVSLHRNTLAVLGATAVTLGPHKYSGTKLGLSAKTC